ncbi:MAG: sGSH, partial [Paenibacillaceae bacterium]|nr:sGSH [Paenibacillaceae bacterium]
MLRHFGFDDISNEKINFPSRLAEDTLPRFLKDRPNKDAPLGVTVPDYLNEGIGTVRDHAELQGSVKQWDAGLGDVLKVLDQEGLADNTLLIVTTDHGLANPRAKTTLYDAGIETLLMIRYPKHVQAGVRCDELI